MADWNAQIGYLTKENPRAAIEQGDRTLRSLSYLIEHPEIGRLGRKQGTRELVISGTPFIVVYRVMPRVKRIELIRVLHGAQQWPLDGI